MLWGFWGKEMTKAKRIELMENAYDVGISSFDYADIYGNYNTENDFALPFLNQDCWEINYSSSQNVGLP
jgi:predicted oxidoreductase